MTLNPDSRRRLTPEEYLAAEDLAEERSEYHDGEVFAMVGAKFAHNAIVSNVQFSLMLQLRDRPCTILGGSMKIHIAADNAFIYPDISVVCGTPAFFDAGERALLNPLAVVEVLSPSTEAYDRGWKFALYRKLPTLSDYLLIAQDEMRIDHFTRRPDGNWLLHAPTAPDGDLALESIGCHLTFADVYRSIEFPERIARTPRDTE